MDRDPVTGLTFRDRLDRRPRRAVPKSGAVWLVVAVVAALLFVLTVRALLQRTAWTAGASSLPATQPFVAAPVEAAYDPPPVAVPMVYRCVDAAGGVSLQSQPCGVGQRMTRAVAAPPDVEPVRPRVVARPEPSRSEPYEFTAPNAAEQRSTQQDARCAMARREREQTLERVGLKRTYDLLQRLDAMVAEACKGA